MITGSVKISPCSPWRCWNTSTVAPRVAAKPRNTGAIRYQGATRLRSSSASTSMITIAATGNTIR